MPRSGAEARRRLQRAALELYVEQGFDRTTTAEIAARAEVNERTFFRHFADKREVLFDGEAEFRVAVADAVAGAPADADPLTILSLALRDAGRLVEDNRSFSEPRSHVIAATPALRERELMKGASLTDVLATALRDRGVDPELAGLAAGIGWATFDRAAKSWLADPSRSLGAHLMRAFDDLRALTAPAAVVTPP